MSLDLDARQRALLQEMGVRVWWPEALAAPPPAAPPSAHVSPPAAVLVAPAPAVPTADAAEPVDRGTRVATDAEPGAIATMDWATLGRTVAGCQACPLCVGRRAPVFAPLATPLQADWLVLGEPPDEAEESAGTPFAAQAGQLLDNMLLALGLRRLDGANPGAGGAYLSNVVKCRPSSARVPQAQELARCEPYLRREVALVQPKVILAMGRFAAQTLLQDSVPQVAGIPLGKLRGQVHRYQGVPVVVTYHPGYLLRNPLDKARAWADLCLAQAQLR